VQAVYDSGKHLLALINDILDMAKIDADQVKLDLQKLDLQPILNDAIRTGASLVKGKSLELSLVAESAIPPIYVDKLRLKQVLLNLISNGVKFTEKGSVKVHYGLNESGDAVLIQVRDTGIGIKESDVGSVFERFRQVDESSTRRAGGTGLGLSITQHLVHLHGGQMGVESQYGVGSTFWLTLPTSEPSERQRRATDEMPAVNAD
jgi:signal transduction histidine kinase